MIKIVLVGNENNEFSKQFVKSISSYGGVIYISNNKIIEYGKKIKFVVIDNIDCSEDVPCDTIVIFKPKCTTNQKQQFNNLSVIVLNDNFDALEKLKGTNNQVIVCGMSVRDTVSLSSTVGEKVNVSIRRNIIRINGEEAEECDISVLKKDYTDFVIMCTGCILCLCGINS